MLSAAGLLLALVLLSIRAKKCFAQAVKFACVFLKLVTKPARRPWGQRAALLEPVILLG